MFRSSITAARLLKSSGPCMNMRAVVVGGGSTSSSSSSRVLAPASKTSYRFAGQQQRNYVVLFHAPESDKKKLTAEEEEMQMELGDFDEDDEEEVVSEEVDKFDDVRFDFSTISYDNYIPGGNDIRSFLNEDNEQIDGGGDQFMSNEDQQEMDAAISSHGADGNYGYRLEHEKPKDKRRRIANRRRGLKSARKVYAMVSYLEMKKNYCASSWENAREDEEENSVESSVEPMAASRPPQRA